MKKKIDRLTKTAYHEAGHVVVAYFLKVPFKYVTINPDKKDGSLGYVLHWPLPKWFRPDIKSSPRIKDKIEQDVIINFAGYIAEKRFAKRNNRIGLPSDIYNAATLSLYIGANRKGTSLFLNWMYHCAESHVNTRWNFIKVIAKALLKTEKLSSKEVKQIILDTIQIKIKKIKIRK